MDYLRWCAEYKEGFCVIKSPEIRLARNLYEGISRINDHPADVFCQMDPEFPKDIQLADNLYGSSLKIISRKLKEFLEKEIINNRIEFLPLRIINHKGRVASRDFFILHPLDLCDCIDLNKSGVEWNAINPNKIASCESLVLKEEVIPNEYKLFRLKYWGEHILIRSDLADTLTVQNFTGLDFKPASGFNGIG